MKTTPESQDKELKESIFNAFNSIFEHSRKYYVNEIARIFRKENDEDFVNSITGEIERFKCGPKLFRNRDEQDKEIDLIIERLKEKIKSPNLPN